MAKPVAGSPYTIVKGDTLSGIAYAAYGQGRKWPRIWEANKSVLQSGDPNLIFPGEVINIPVLTELQPEAASDLELLATSEPIEDVIEDFQVVIKGKPIKVKSARALRTMDTASDGWNAVIYWDPNDSDLADLIRPYSYNETKIYVGGQLVITGPLYVTEVPVKNDELPASIAGFSYTKDLVDSTLDPPYSRNGITLNQLANELAIGKGIKVVDDTPSAGVFERVTSEPTDTIFAHLAKLAKQKSRLISSTPRGELLILQANTTGAPVGSIGDELARGHDYTVRFDGTQRFNVYRLTSKRRGAQLREAVAVDSVVPRSRVRTIDANDTTDGDIGQAANWERSKALADALTMPFPVSGWYAPDGTLWRENTLVTVVSARMFIPDGFTFLIKSVEYIFEPDGKKSVLNLVPPQVYTGEELEEPWVG
jgi:prophage tail gpP-like protein